MQYAFTHTHPNTHTNFPLQRTQMPSTAFMQHVSSLVVASPAQPAPPQEGAGLEHVRAPEREEGPQVDVQSE